MPPEVRTVTLDLDAQGKPGQFTLPKAVCRLLDVKSKDNVYLIIDSMEGRRLFEGIKMLNSGTELYGQDLRDCIKAGQRIRVTVSRPEHRPDLDRPEPEPKSLEERVAELERKVSKLTVSVPPASRDSQSIAAIECEGDVGEFVDDDDAYLRWIKDHPDGFVINSFRNPTPEYMVLHRVTCRSISSAAGMTEPGGFTERRYIKICGLSKEALTDWTRRNGRSDGTFSSLCGACKP